MAYNLPPPWDAGYALPDNVRDEGLERRAFVTKQMPRGTYDMPNVGSGGYVLPDYIKTEGYGQGARVTKWMPRGTRANVPHYLDQRPRVVKQRSVGPKAVDVTIAPAALAGVPTPSLHKRFGDRAAAGILARVQRLPQASRKEALKKALDRIDPTLWSRTATLAESFRRSGMTAANALLAGLSQAMTTGLTAELVNTGMSRRMPQPTSLLGLGIDHARRAMGALETEITSVRTQTKPGTETTKPGLLDAVLSTSKAGATSTSTTVPVVLTDPNRPNFFFVGGQWVRSGPEVDGTCDSSGTLIFRWNATTNTGAWQRKQASDVCKGILKTSAACDWRTPESTAASIKAGCIPPGGVVVTNTDGTVVGTGTGAALPPKATQFVQIGPWNFGLDGGAIREHRDQTPKDWMQWIIDQLARAGAWARQKIGFAMVGGGTINAHDFLWMHTQTLETTVVYSANEFYDKKEGWVLVPKDWFVGKAPIAKVTHPTKGNDWGLFLTMGIDADNPTSFSVEFKKLPDKNWLEKAFDWIVRLIGKIVDFIGDVVDFVGGLACDVFSDPQGASAAAAAGAAAGPVGVGAAVVGAAVASQLCSKPPPPPPPPPADTSSSILPVALAAGGIVLLAVVLKKKKRKKAP